MERKTLLQAFQQFESNPYTDADMQKFSGNTSDTKKTKGLIENARSVIRLVLTIYGLEKDANKRMLENFMTKIDLKDFIKDAPEKLEEAFNKQGIPLKNQYTPRSNLNRFINKWLPEQDWYKDIVSDEINQYAPVQTKNKKGKKEYERVTGKRRKPNYRLELEQLTLLLRKEVNDWILHWTDLYNDERTEDPITEGIAKTYKETILCTLGWIHKFAKEPVERLLNKQVEDLELSDLCNPRLVRRFITWLRIERENCPSSEVFALRAFLSVARYVYRKDAEDNYSNTSVVKEIRKMIREGIKDSKKAPPVADLSKKDVDWLVLRNDVLEILEKECAPLTASGGKRSASAIAQKKQIFLIISIFLLTPCMRQRGMRELEVGKTLFYEDGWWVIRLGEHHKNGKYYDYPPLPIPQDLNPWIEDWLANHRKAHNPNHSCVFTQKNGKTLSDSAVYSLVTKNIKRITGKHVHPHHIRRLQITALLRAGLSRDEAVGLAKAMGHSLKMQQDIYNLMTEAEKVKPGIDALNRLNNSIFSNKFSTLKAS